MRYILFLFVLCFMLGCVSSETESKSNQTKNPSKSNSKKSSAQSPSQEALKQKALDALKAAKKIDPVSSVTEQIQDANAVPVAEAIKNNSGLERMINNINKAINANDWGEYLELCDPQHYMINTKMGIDETQYIIESLGLSHKTAPFNNRDAKGHDKLKPIKRISIQSASVSTYVTLFGEAILKDQSSLPVKIYLKPNRGFYLISGPQG